MIDWTRTGGRTHRVVITRSTPEYEAFAHERAVAMAGHRAGLGAPHAPYDPMPAWSPWPSWGSLFGIHNNPHNDWPL